MTPKVSICMPVYNSAGFLREAIESVLSQEFNDYECVIIDDCSSDRSREIAQEYVIKDGRIIFKKNERNAGMVENWNRCLREARGEYIKFLFGDDAQRDPGTVGRMAGILDADPRVALVASARWLLNEESRALQIISEYRSGTYAGAEIIKDCLIEQKNHIGEPSAVMFRRRQASRGFDIRYSQIADQEMWLHLLEQGMFAFINEPLNAFRQHAGQQTRRNMNRYETVKEPFLLIEGYAGKPYVDFFPWQRAYMRSVAAHGVWKLYKRHKKINRTRAVSMLRQHSFTAPVVFPFYLCKPLYKGFMVLQRLSRKQKFEPRA